MRPEGRIVAAAELPAVDHSLVIAAISLVADSGARVDGRDLAHIVHDLCAGLPPDSVTPEEIALLAVTVIDMKNKGEAGHALQL